MRVVVTGATGNVGTSVLDAFRREPEVDSILGIARRRPEVELPGAEFAAADVAADELAPLFDGADAVIHLAWLIQPSRDEGAMERTNVEGSRRVFAAAVAAGVPAIVHASSVGAYSRGPKNRFVDESWPVEGIESSAYSRQKARVEAMLDEVARTNPDLRVARLRPGLIFKAEAASEVKRYFVGPLLPGALVRERLIPFVPEIARLRFQAVHSEDVGEAYRAAAVGDVEGAFNIAAEPAIGPAELAELLHARRVKVPARGLRAAAAASWRLRLQPADPGWIDLALGVPLMDGSRARDELGWEPRTTSLEAMAELLDGLRHASGGPTPPLATHGQLAP